MDATVANYIFLKRIAIDSVTEVRFSTETRTVFCSTTHSPLCRPISFYSMGPKDKVGGARC